METTDTVNTELNDTEFSPQRFIVQVRDASRYIISKWLIVLLFSAVAGTAIWIYLSYKEPVYAAELTFALDEEATQSAKNGFVEIGEELGLGSSAIDASGALFGKMTNIAELMQSRFLIEKTLRDSVVLSPKSKPLIFADFFADSLNYRQKIMVGEQYDKLAFNSRQDTLAQNAAIAAMYDILLKKYLKVEKKGKETTIVSVSCNTEHELFSKYFLEMLVKEVTGYYTDIRTQRAKANLAFIEKRMDSIRPAYSGALYSRASFSDAHTNPVRQIAVVSNEKQQTDVQILKASYIELARNLEAAKIAVVRVTPLIQYLDRPVLPLKRSGIDKMKYFIIFFIAGAAISIVFLLFGYFIRSIMGTQNKEEEIYYPEGY